MKTNKKFWGIFVLTIAMIVSVGCAKTSNSTKSSSSSSSKSEKIDLQKDFYQGEKQLAKELVDHTIKAPDSIQGYVKAADSVIIGKVVNLKEHVSNGRAFTLATVEVTRVLKSGGVKLNQKIPVLFAGGNISATELLAKGATPSQKDANSEKITIEYGWLYLPNVNDEFCLFLTKLDKGTNGMKKAFYSPNLEFKKQADGKYILKEVTEGTLKDSIDIPDPAQRTKLNTELEKYLNKQSK